MSRSPFIKLSPALAALTFALTASAGLPEVSGSKVAFIAVGPAGLKIEGTGDKITVVKDKDKANAIVFKSSVASLKTGMGLRDKHLKGYLKTDDFPDASMSIDEGKLKKAASGKEINGTFRLHGVNQPATVKYKATKKGDAYAVDATFKVDITKHGIEQPCYLGVCVDPVVDVKVNFTIKE